MLQPKKGLTEAAYVLFIKASAAPTCSSGAGTSAPHSLHPQGPNSFKIVEITVVHAELFGVDDSGVPVRATKWIDPLSFYFATRSQCSVVENCVRSCSR